MNATNRVVNRALLLLTGLLLAAAGALAVLVANASRYPAARTVTEPAGQALSTSKDWAAGLPQVAGAPGAVAVGVAGAVVLAALLVTFLLTRGRGRTGTVVEVRSADGRTSVAENVADAALAGTLSARPDVLAARTGVYRVRRTTSIDLDVTVRRGADLARVLSAAQDAVADWDELAGMRVPVLVHLSDRSWLDGLRASTRVR